MTRGLNMDTTTAQLVASSTVQIAQDNSVMIVILIIIACFTGLDFVRRFLMPNKL